MSQIKRLVFHILNENKICWQAPKLVHLHCEHLRYQLRETIQASEWYKEYNGHIDVSGIQM